jgi:hypothetical protein
MLFARNVQGEDIRGGNAKMKHKQATKSDT